MHSSWRERSASAVRRPRRRGQRRPHPILRSPARRAALEEGLAWRTLSSLTGGTARPLHRGLAAASTRARFRPGPDSPPCGRKREADFSRARPLRWRRGGLRACPSDWPPGRLLPRTWPPPRRHCRRGSGSSQKQPTVEDARQVRRGSQPPPAGSLDRRRAGWVQATGIKTPRSSSVRPARSYRGDRPSGQVEAAKFNGEAARASPRRSSDQAQPLPCRRRAIRPRPPRVARGWAWRASTASASSTDGKDGKKEAWTSRRRATRSTSRDPEPEAGLGGPRSRRR